MASRLPPKNRRDQLLTAALEVARKVGYIRVERAAVAEAAGCSPTLISHYFKSMPELRNEILREAIKREDAAILGQGLAVGDDIAQSAPAALKAAARSAL